MDKPLELYDELIVELDRLRAKNKDLEDELVGLRLLLRDYVRRTEYLENVLFRMKR